MVKNKVCLIVIDGWGISENEKGEFLIIYLIYISSEYLLLSLDKVIQNGKFL